MSIRGFEKALKGLAPGALFFLGYYEVIAALRIPFNFTINRITYTYLFQAPLFSFFEIDLASSILLITILLYERRLSLRDGWLISIMLLSLIMALSFMVNIMWLAHLALGLICLFTSILYVGIRRISGLLPGFLVSLLILEVMSLASITSYYALGEWSRIPLQITLRERFFWSTLEWASVPLLIISIWNALIHSLTGKHIFRLSITFFPQRESKDDKNITMLFLSLTLNLLLVILPHLPTVNPDFKPVSVDVTYYGLFLEEAERYGLTETLANRNMGRPIYLLAIYWLWVSMGRNTILLMDLLHPLAALIGLTLVSFHVARKINGEEAAGWAALLIPLGYTAAGFLSGGFQANSVALTLALLTLIIGFKNFKSFLTLTALLAIVGLIHPWTYLMYSAAIVLRSLKSKRSFTFSIASLVLSYCLIYAVNSVFTSGSYRVETPLTSLATSIGLHIPRNWFDAVRLWIWNALSNPIYLSAAILPPNPLLSSIMGVAAPLTLTLDAEMTCRIILNLPLQIQASNLLKKIKDGRMRTLIILALLTRVLGNISGLTPLATENI